MFKWTIKVILVFLVLTLNIIFYIFSSVSIVDFEQVIVCWEDAKMRQSIQEWTQ